MNFDGKVYLYCDCFFENGFNFCYFINEYVICKGIVYCFVYDQGYIEWENGYFMFVV